MQKAIRKYLISRVLPDATPTINHVLGGSKVVLLLGWGGSKKRNLLKLEQYYIKEGISTVTHIMPLWIPSLLRQYFENEIEETLIEATKTGKGLFVHSYSNNGLWVFGELSRRGKIAPEALIIDSAPWLFYTKLPVIDEARALSRVATSIIMRGPVYYHAIVTPIVQSVLFCSISLGRFIESIQGPFPIIPDLVSLNKYLRDESPRIRTLLIYSKGDKLIPPECIHEFKTHLESRNIEVHEKVFGEDVAHTSSFYRHPAEYTKAVEDFLGTRKKKENAHD